MINHRIRKESERLHPSNETDNRFHKEHYRIYKCKVNYLKLPGIDNELFVSIYAEDFSIHPHFHIEDIYGNEYACICIDIPEYYDHNDGYNNRLSNDQIDEFIHWLYEIAIYNREFNCISNISNWQFILDQYVNASYTYNEVIPNKSLLMPDYNLLKRGN